MTTSPVARDSSLPTRHAQDARRAVRNMLKARERGDQLTADVYAKLAAQAIDRHLAARRSLS
jgi:hypothetical protein